MDETRQIIGHGPHALRGPHVPLPAEFVPLQLCIEATQLHVDIACAVAIVGRHTEADLRLAYPEVSRHHCRLSFESGEWRVYDLNSTNGLYLNNARIREATLYAGDRLFLGCVYLLIKSATPAPILRAAESEKLRQIAEVLPIDPVRRAS